MAYASAKAPKRKTSGSTKRHRGWKHKSYTRHHYIYSLLNWLDRVMPIGPWKDIMTKLYTKPTPNILIYVDGEVVDKKYIQLHTPPAIAAIDKQIEELEARYSAKAPRP
jgi:hypothetical protein